ncbi:hypothetical protein SKAU_G00297950 [Synaphobranchus kaupii]|uniref:Ig-like domain-containing protein n=1 Tax=Synaphobranchus kaupii TaxID=118154 RepID=A0A9Q1EV76_SYNKA|nr:hypothetical protein SKAU_G00297950 [Synaphobranchus kaupii]
MHRGLLRLLIAGYCVAYTVSECPIKIEPSTVVVRHGDPVLVNCTVSGDHLGIGWEASEGSVDMVTDVQFVTWSLETVTDWEMAPRCFGNFPTEAGPPLQCEEKINIALYEPPDSVSISAVNHTGPVVEGEKYQLQCEVQNIAPVQYFTVKWYKGETLENQTSYNDLTKTPVDVSSTLLITPTSADDGAQYSCVAELELGPEGPQPPPSITSEPLTITVHYSVSISAVNHTGPVVEGEKYQLQCEVQNIAPVQYFTVKWYKGETLENQTSYNDLTKTPVEVSSTLLITPTSADDGAQYSCVAELELGPEGPQPPPSITSEPLTITVHYPPLFYSDMDEILEVTEGEGVPLNCSAQGNPPPEYAWSSPLNQDDQEEKKIDTLITSTSLSPGTYNYSCTVTNDLGAWSKRFTVKIIPMGDQTVLWTMIGVGVAVAVLLIAGYVIHRSRDGGNSII